VEESNRSSKPAKKGWDVKKDSRERIDRGSGGDDDGDGNDSGDGGDGVVSVRNDGVSSNKSAHDTSNAAMEARLRRAGVVDFTFVRRSHTLIGEGNTNTDTNTNTRTIANTNADADTITSYNGIINDYDNNYSNNTAITSASFSQTRVLIASPLSSTNGTSRDFYNTTNTTINSYSKFSNSPTKTNNITSTKIRKQEPLSSPSTVNTFARFARGEATEDMSALLRGTSNGYGVTSDGHGVASAGQVVASSGGGVISNGHGATSNGHGVSSPASSIGLRRSEEEEREDEILAVCTHAHTRLDAHTQTNTNTHKPKHTHTHTHTNKHTHTQTHA
jgi:hypothetical protein